MVCIQSFKQTGDIFGISFNAVIVDALFKLVLVELTITRVIHDTEGASKTNKAA
jgi:hypothetical protein